MSQSLIYISRSAGISKKGNAYDIVRVATPKKPYEPFIITNGCGDALDHLTEGDEFEAEIFVEARYGNAAVNLVKVS